MLDLCIFNHNRPQKPHIWISSVPSLVVLLNSGLKDSIEFIRIRFAEYNHHNSNRQKEISSGGNRTQAQKECEAILF